MKTKTLFYLLLLAVGLLAIVLHSCCEEPDVFAPSAPSGLEVVSSTTTTISLAWLASTDNVGVEGYSVYRDGVLAETVVFSTSFTDENLVPNSQYIYTVSAFDKAGNVSELSEPLTATTLDDCPTCSKWMQEITFTPPATTELIYAGEEKSAGTLLVKNISTSSHTANLTLSFPDLVSPAIDSLSYTIGEEIVKQKVAGSITLNEVSVPANSTTEIKLSYRVKEVIPEGIPDQSQISLSLTATTTDEAGVVQPRNGFFPSVNLHRLKFYTAKIDTSKSYEASAVAEDKVLFGNSVAKAFVLEVTTPGTVRLEVVGKTNDQASAIKYFWINDKDDEDFYTSVSTLNPIVSKTRFGNDGFIELNLKAGTNVIAFKTNPYSGQIANGAKVGLKVAGNGFSLENNSYTADSSADNLAAIIKVWARWSYNFSLGSGEYGTNFGWGGYNLLLLDENENYDENARYPIIEKMANDARFWAENYPTLAFAKVEGKTPWDFEENFKILGALFGSDIYPVTGFGTVFAKDLANNSIKYEDGIIYYSGPPVQIESPSSYAYFANRVAVYNFGDKAISAVVRGFDPYPAGWKFTGNPELELWTHAEESVSRRIQ